MNVTTQITVPEIIGQNNNDVRTIDLVGVDSLYRYENNRRNQEWNQNLEFVHGETPSV